MEINEIKYIEEQIQKLIKSIETEFFYFVMDEQSKNTTLQYYPDWTKQLLQDQISELYLLIVSYLESKGMPLFLKEFKKQFSTLAFDKTNNFKSNIFHPEGDPELELINGYKRFLASFRFFDYNAAKDDEEKRVFSILENTDYIIKKLKTTIKNEASIYNEVKWILSIYYPSCREKMKASFIQEFKSYEPDILIPELKVAIEYKYLRASDKQSKIEEYIDAIRIDATNYEGDYRYESFIAVIYVEDSAIATPASIRVAWKAKKFPANWKLIISNNTSASLDTSSS